MIVVDGDALDPSERVVAHGCNLLGKMAKGFALQVRNRHPGSYDAYMEAFERGDLVLGSIVRWDGDGRTILHCLTQSTIGKTGFHVDYEALRSCMARIERKAAHDISTRKGLFHTWPRVAMPRIGSGLGGGDRAIVESIVRDEIRSVEVAIYNYVPKGRTHA